MSKEEEFLVLIHPNKSVFTKSRHKIWTEWKNHGCKVILGTGHVPTTIKELEDTSYVDNLEKGTTVVLGGQRADWCESIHYESLINHPRVKNKEISVEVDQSASCGGNFKSMEEIASQHGIVYRIR